MFSLLHAMPVIPLWTIARIMSGEILFADLGCCVGCTNLGLRTAPKEFKQRRTSHALPFRTSKWRLNGHVSRILWALGGHFISTLADPANQRGHLVPDVQSLAEISKGPTPKQPTNAKSGEGGVGEWLDAQTVEA